MSDLSPEINPIPKTKSFSTKDFIGISDINNSLYWKRADLMEQFINLNKQERGIFDPKKPDFKNQLKPFLSDEKNHRFINEVLQNITNVKRPFPEDNAAYSDLGQGNPYQTIDEKIVSWAFDKRQAGPREGETNFAAYRVIKSFYDYYQKNPDRLNQDKEIILEFCQTAFGKKTGEVLKELIIEVVEKKEVDIDQFQKKIKSFLEEESSPKTETFKEQPDEEKKPLPESISLQQPVKKDPVIKNHQPMNDQTSLKKISPQKINDQEETNHLPENKSKKAPQKKPASSGPIFNQSKEKQKINEENLSPYFIKKEKVLAVVKEMTTITVKKVINNTPTAIFAYPLTYKKSDREISYLPFIYYIDLVKDKEGNPPAPFIRKIGKAPEALIVYPNKKVYKINEDGVRLTEDFLIIYGNKIFKKEEENFLRELTNEETKKITEDLKEILTPEAISEIQKDQPFPPLKIINLTSKTNPKKSQNSPPFPQYR